MRNLELSVILLVITVLACQDDEKSDAYGNFEADETIVSAESNGKLLMYDIEEGQTIAMNQIMGVIDTMPFYLQKQQLKASKAAVSSKVSNILSQIAIYKEQRATLLTDKERIVNLLKDGAATQKQLDDINGQLNVINKQIQSIETQNQTVLNEIKSMEWQIKLMEENIDNCKVANPVKGTVLENYVEPGEFVTMGKSLYKIANLDELELRVYVSGAQLPHISLGQKVEVYIDENKEENKKLEGTVSWISDQAEFSPKIIQTKEERVKLVYAVKVRVKNNGMLKIGMPGEIKFMNHS
jgi:HlyD family secretion protein